MGRKKLSELSQKADAVAEEAGRQIDAGRIRKERAEAQALEERLGKNAAARAKAHRK